ncbi:MULTISPECIES: hypothetical protein [unclassified Crossiella]|uniref:hypothetical protein n=1 Tax=unclassified Crossiella TaxID=2620835 RepID=UPI001FFFE7A4|nr:MULTISPECIES: hypothetical protein [unclassified Crossiella]MCK2237163.1 hypothetical protein [Crossiella sp. S99.2]MCK2252526.1 hypothetical protein [Crossiella sp. S99.1]
MGENDYPAGRRVHLLDSAYDGKTHIVIVAGTDKRGSQILTGCYLYRDTTKIGWGARPGAVECFACMQKSRNFVSPK